MQLRRIEVRAFRKLKHTVVDGLSDGLNVIVGDNEAGKSTLLAALRAVLFERHRVGGQTLASILPHGLDDARPEIAVDFVLGGNRFTLRKAFNQKPEAELTLPDGQRVSGDAVEDRMATLLGFAAPGNRGSKPAEHQGVYGLLWVDQGLAHGRLEAGGGQDRLSAALESEVGTVVGGERGRQLLARAEERRRFFWDGRDKPRGPFRQAQERVLSLEVDRAALEARLRRHDEQVAALAAKTDILARYRRDERLAQATRDVEAARGRARVIEQLDATLREVRGAKARAAADGQAAAERLRAREALVERASSREAASLRAAEAAAVADRALRVAEAAARAAAERLETARRQRGAREARLAALERLAAARKAREELARAAHTLGEAESIATLRRTAIGIAAGIAVKRSDLAGLDRLCAARDEASARLQAASVQITVESGAPDFAIDGVRQAPDVPLLLAHDAVLDLPGFGRLRVRPGGGVEALAAAARDAAIAVEAALSRLGYPSRTAVAEALARKADAEAEAATQDRLSAHLAPAGLEVLRQAVETLRAAAVAHDEPPADADEDRVALREILDAARRAEQREEAERGRADLAREDAARTAAILGERAAAALRENEDAARSLDAARAASPDNRLAESATLAAEATALAAQAEATAAGALDSADPELAALMLQRAEQAATAIRADIEALTRERRDLEVELRTLGQEGFGEQHAEIEGRLARARQTLAAQSLDAAASRLLETTLAAAQRETKDRWLGPVRDKVAPYLRLLQPDSEIVLNERDFSVEHLLRRGVREPFDTLSVGAREQVAVITRLALADILHGAGQPTAIILDDALVNTDEARIERMHLVLQRAAANLQVLVLTCRERDFVGLGAPIHRL